MTKWRRINQPLHFASSELPVLLSLWQRGHPFAGYRTRVDITSIGIIRKYPYSRVTPCQEVQCLVTSRKYGTSRNLWAVIKTIGFSKALPLFHFHFLWFWNVTLLLTLNNVVEILFSLKPTCALSRVAISTTKWIVM